MNPYYVILNDQQQGPFSIAQLEEMLDTGMLKSTDLCWREGMADWQSIETALPGLLALSTQRTGVAFSAAADATTKNPRKYGGLGRGAFNLIWAGLLFVTQGLLSRFDDDQQLVQGISGISIILMVILIIPRLRNTGQSLWTLLLLFVPGLNVLYLITLIFYLHLAKEGHAKNKNADSGGRKMVRLLGMGLAVIVITMAYSLLATTSMALFQK